MLALGYYCANTKLRRQASGQAGLLRLGSYWATTGLLLGYYWRAARQDYDDWAPIGRLLGYYWGITGAQLAQS